MPQLLLVCVYASQQNKRTICWYSPVIKAAHILSAGACFCLSHIPYSAKLQGFINTFLIDSMHCIYTVTTLQSAQSIVIEMQKSQSHSFVCIRFLRPRFNTYFFYCIYNSNIMLSSLLTTIIRSLGSGKR